MDDPVCFVPVFTCGGYELYMRHGVKNHNIYIIPKI